MSRYVLSFKPAIGPYGMHDPSAVIFNDGELIYGVEEERLIRQKHATATFPEQAIQSCLDYCDIRLPDVDSVVLPYNPQLKSKIFKTDFCRRLARSSSIPECVQSLERFAEQHIGARFMPTTEVERALRRIDTPIPPISLKSHHACHASSAFHPSPFDDALVLTLDGKGEYDSTVIWQGTNDGVERLRTYKFPNSLGHFYGIITEFLGYRSFNGEGKIMGLAPYANDDPEIESTLRSSINMGVNYDVTPITRNGIEQGVNILEELFGRERNDTPGEFTQWEQNLAYTSQKLLEEIVTDIVEAYCSKLQTNNVCLAGGVALNCKMNKRVMEHDAVDSIYIQPVANDAGLALGGGWINQQPTSVPTMDNIYVGPSFDRDNVKSVLETKKISHTEPEELEKNVAKRLADGELVGWFQGKLEMGPRALGNRSILADPRTSESRDRVNKYVKHREEWRPFAPSIIESAADDYFENAEPSPFMIKTFDVKTECRDEIEAVLHPADDTTRPQTVREDQNPRYYQLIREFERLTDVPVVLNTSFNDHGEPIVTTPKEALKDFYGMGLDTLVLGDFLVEK
jgi:carbamoyltransferase